MAWWLPLVAALATSAIGKIGGSTKDKTKKIPTMTPGGQQFLDQLFNQLGSGGLGQSNTNAMGLLNQLMNPSSQATQQFTQPYMDQFNQQIVPGLAERFAGAGALGGGLSSSGFGQSLSAAGGNLQNTLAALKSQLGMQAANQLMGQYSNLAGMGLNSRPFGYTYQPGGPGVLQSALTGYSQAGFPGLQEGGDWFKSLFTPSNPAASNSLSRGGNLGY